MKNTKTLYWIDLHPYTKIKPYNVTPDSKALIVLTRIIVVLTQRDRPTPLHTWPPNHSYKTQVGCSSNHLAWVCHQPTPCRPTTKHITLPQNGRDRLHDAILSRWTWDQVSINNGQTPSPFPAFALNLKKKKTCWVDPCRTRLWMSTTKHEVMKSPQIQRTKPTITHHQNH